MKIILATVLSLSLSFSAFAQGRGFRAEYKGGTFVAKGDDGRMFVSSETIRLEMEDGERLTIVPKDVSALSYGTEASRRVSLWLTLGIVLTPIALFGLFAKRKNHFIGVEYADPAGQKGAIMIRADKHEYRAMLASLRSVTGKKVEGLDGNGNGSAKKNDDWHKMSDQQ